VLQLKFLTIFSKLAWDKSKMHTADSVLTSHQAEPADAGLEHRLDLGLLERIRREELNAIRPYISPGARVLEIGGGSGFQASLLASWGFKVTSIDLADRPRRRRQYYPVQDYNGLEIPFQQASFDVVFSSNVLEHVVNLRELILEAKRVLAPDGRAIHIIPTSSWRVWTGLAHYPYLIKRICGNGDIPSAEVVPQAQGILSQRGLFYLLKKAVLAGAHGAYPSALHEVFYYRKKRWIRVFEECGFIPEAVLSASLFYTGYSLWPNTSIEARRRLARALGSSCLVYVLQRS
jgi:SAM-dependent methyltransferase